MDHLNEDLDRAALLAELRFEVAWTTPALWAVRHGVPEAELAAVLAGDVAPSDAILEALGYTRVERYRRVLRLSPAALRLFADTIINPPAPSAAGWAAAQRWLAAQSPERQRQVEQAVRAAEARVHGDPAAWARYVAECAAWAAVEPTAPAVEGALSPEARFWAGLSPAMARTWRAVVRDALARRASTARAAGEPDWAALAAAMPPEEGSADD